MATIVVMVTIVIMDVVAVANMTDVAEQIRKKELTLNKCKLLLKTVCDIFLNI